MKTVFKKGAVLALAFAGLMAVDANGQTVIISESFGVSGGSVALDSFSGYDNSGLTFESIGGADVRDSTASTSEYTGASGGNNVFLTDNTEGFAIIGINQSSFTDFYITFGAYEAVGSYTGFASDIFGIEYSTDATTASNGNWNILSFTPSVQVDNGWQDAVLQSATIVTGGASNLSLRFNNNTASTQDIRIDDVSVFGVTAVPEPSSFALISLGLGTLLCMRRRR